MAEDATTIIPEEEGLQQADSRLLHMWEVKDSLQKRLKRNKRNHPLKGRIAKLNLEIQEYADKLALQNWHALCERTELQMSTAKAWNILRHLIDPTKSKTEQCRSLEKLLHTHNRGDVNETIREMRAKYTPEHTPPKIIETQRTAHLERLTKTATGRHLLDSLRIPYEQTFEEKLSIPAELRKSIHVPPLPRNMHPLYNEKRRELRAQALEKQLGEDPQVVYTDAANYKRRGTMVSVVTDHSGKVLAACSIRTKHPEEGEELAIALALATTHARKIKATNGPTRLLEISPTESPRHPAHISRATPEIASVLTEKCSITTKGKDEPTRLPTPRSPRGKKSPKTLTSNSGPSKGPKTPPGAKTSWPSSKAPRACQVAGDASKRISSHLAPDQDMTTRWL
ncbi:hypothetical protein HPB47_016108 [Ixodes persulcatus]|uniref:Uncharacterized protein n=1 Tax=Ixodes persulcatus TaxID=34615 RepID=A0AC60QVC9_IXOPE|nr:hypothetical protein HPB47_016108 [Ixodes persulcatus]